MLHLGKVLAKGRPQRKSEGSKVDFFDGSWVQHILASYGYAAVFIVVMLESAGVPLPGETILVSAAAFAGNRHSLDIRYVVAAAAGGAIIGDNIGFWVGREFGTSLLARWGYLIGLDERKRKLGQYLFTRHGGKIVFFGRFVALLRAFAALLAGANRLSPLRFLIFNAAGGIVWATVFGVGGYVLGEGIRRIAGPFGWAVLFGAIVFAFLLWRYYKKNEERFLDEAEAAAADDAHNDRAGARGRLRQTCESLKRRRFVAARANGCLSGYVSATTGVAQIAAELLRRPSRQCRAMCGRLRVGKSFLHGVQQWSEQPCVRPVSAVHVTAGHNALRGSGPGQFHAFDHAVARVGCPDRRIDRLCITCCSPFPTVHITPDARRDLFHAASATGSL